MWYPGAVSRDNHSAQPDLAIRDNEYQRVAGNAERLFITNISRLSPVRVEQGISCLGKGSARFDYEKGDSI